MGGWVGWWVSVGGCGWVWVGGGGGGGLLFFLLCASLSSQAVSTGYCLRSCFPRGFTNYISPFSPVLSSWLHSTIESGVVHPNKGAGDMGEPYVRDIRNVKEGVMDIVM